MGRERDGGTTRKTGEERKGREEGRETGATVKREREGGEGERLRVLIGAGLPADDVSVSHNQDIYGGPSRLHESVNRRKGSQVDA